MKKAEEKAFLRRALRQLEQAETPAARAESSRRITAHLLAMPAYRDAGTVFCFVGTAQEPDTTDILRDALARGKRLCVPACVGKGIMELRQITSLEQLTPGFYGIPEPPQGSPRVDADAVDLAVLPCLGCSRSGHRLGRGGGYYDRFLAHYRGGAVVLCREQMLREDIPQEPHDYPVPWVLTERGLWEDGMPARLG